MDINKLIDKLHPLERKVLPVLAEETDFEDITKKAELKKVEVVRALQWLENKGVITIKDESREVIELGSNGKKYAKIGLPERRFLNAIDDEILLSDLTDIADVSKEEVNITLGVLRRRAAVEIEKLPKDLNIKLTEQGNNLKSTQSIEEKFLGNQFPIPLDDLRDEEKFAYTELKKRRDIIKVDVIRTKTVKLTKTGLELLKKKIDFDYIEKLTPAILKSGIWKKQKFRSYDVEINVPQIYGGKKHFVNQGIDYIKKVWMDLGFKEMKGNLVQTSFWDLDALFVPQDHPARDEQDTFYIKDPKYGKLPKKFEGPVSKTHENGWKTGSKGWQYKWSPKIAKENLLRTHTTVLSAQTISKLKMEDLPAKFFSVKRVYRNETLSWKHLFEFVQVEGIVIDPDANFKHLVGYLKNFFAKLGFPDARIRPGHFPYTEPSAEVDVWHPRKKAWVELGGAGIFRPEVVQPLLGKPVPVLAWGLGLERSIMENYKITDIRDLYKNDLKQLREIKTWMK